MTKPIKSIRSSLDAPAKYGYGQIVEFKLSGFYKTCSNRGELVEFDLVTREYRVGEIQCPKEGTGYSTAIDVKESDIIRVIEEENK